MGILGTIAKLIMAPKLKKSFEKAWEIAKDDPELIKALTDLKGYHERLDELQYSMLERLGKDHPKYDPVEQAKRRERIESRKQAEISKKEDLFVLAEYHNFYCDKSYWLNQDLKDLVRIITYLEKVGPLKIDGLNEFFEEFIKKNNDENTIISLDDLMTHKDIKKSFFKALFSDLDYKLSAKNFIKENLKFENVLMFLFPYFIFTNKKFYTFSHSGISLKWRELDYFEFIGSISFRKDNFLKEEVKRAEKDSFWTTQYIEFNNNLKKNKWILSSSSEANPSLNLFEKLQLDLKEFLEIYKKEHIKIAPKLLEEIKKLTKN